MNTELSEEEITELAKQLLAECQAARIIEGCWEGFDWDDIPELYQEFIKRVIRARDKSAK